MGGGVRNDPAREERQTDILTTNIFLLQEIPTFSKKWRARLNSFLWFCLLFFVFFKQPMVRGVGCNDSAREERQTDILTVRPDLLPGPLHLMIVNTNTNHKIDTQAPIFRLTYIIECLSDRSEDNTPMMMVNPWMEKICKVVFDDQPFAKH